MHSTVEDVELEANRERETERRNAFGTARSYCYRQNLSNPAKSPLLLKFQDLHYDDVAQDEKLRKESNRTEEQTTN